jgi:hypothetical protein
VNLAGIGSPTWSSSLVGFLELAGGQPEVVPGLVEVVVAVPSLRPAVW